MEDQHLHHQWLCALCLTACKGYKFIKIHQDAADVTHGIHCLGTYEPAVVYESESDALLPPLANMPIILTYKF